MARAATVLSGLTKRWRLEGANVPLTSTLLLHWLAGRQIDSGVAVNATTAVGQAALWRGINVLAGTISGLEIIDENGKGERQDNALFVQPHSWYTSVEWLTIIMVHRLLHGNAFIYKERNPLTNRIVGLYPLDPRRIKPKLISPAGRRKLPSEKVFLLTPEDGSEVMALGDDEIMQLPGLCYNGVEGLGIVPVLAQAVGIALASDKFAAKFYGSGTLASGFLTTDKKLDQTAADALKQRWQDKVSGLDNAAQVAVLDAGAKFESLTIPPEQAQFLQTREFNVREMARVTGVPAHLLMAETHGGRMGSGIEQEIIGLVRFTIEHHTRVMEARFTLELLPRGHRARFFIDPLLEGDTRARFSAYLLARKANVLTINEIRKREREPPLEDARADDVFTPTNDTAAGAADGGGADGNQGNVTGNDQGDGTGTEEPNVQ